MNSDRGSTLPLLIALALLALATVSVLIAINSLSLAQSQLETIADDAALAAAGSFQLSELDARGGELHASLDARRVTDSAARLVAAAGGGRVQLIVANSPDGVSVRVRVRESWEPPLISAFLPIQVPLEAQATARLGFR